MATAEYDVEAGWDTDIVDNCDSNTGWGAGGSFTEGLNTTNQVEGTGCLQSVCAGAVAVAESIFRSHGLTVGATGKTTSDYLAFDLYVDDASAVTEFVVELSSSTSDDAHEYQWGSIHASLVDGWNVIRLLISDAGSTGTPDLDAIVRIRMYGTTSGAVTFRLDNIRLLFAGSNITADVRNQPGIKISRGKDQIRALAPPAAGALDLELDNQSQDYSAEYGSSPLVGLLNAGVEVRVRALSGGSLYNLGTGAVQDFPQHPERSRRSVGLQCLGSLSRLKGIKVSTALYSNISTGTALGHLLDAAGWPSDDRVIEAGNTTLLWWWLGDEDAFDAAVALLNTDGPGAALYEDGQGRIVFESRYYRLLTTRANTSQATISDTGSEPLHSPPFGYALNTRNTINECNITVNVREQAAALSAVWEYGQRLTLGPSEALEIPVSAADPFTGAINPAGGTDYTVISGSVASAALDRSSGSHATLTVTAGAGGCMIDDLQVRAYSVPVSYSRVASNTIDTTTSQGRYGLRSYSLPIRPEIAFRTAEDFCNAIVSWYQEPAPTIEVTLNNGHADRLAQILTREISDRVTLVEAQTGLDDDAWIEQIGHLVQAGGKYQTCRLGCSKVPTLNYWIWGTSKWGTGVFGW